MKSIKEVTSDFIKRFVDRIKYGWKRLGEPDVNDSQDVQVTLPPEVQAQIGALELVTNHAYMSKEKKPNQPNIAPPQRGGMPNTRTTIIPERQNNGKTPDGRIQPIRPIDGRDTYRDI